MFLCAVVARGDVSSWSGLLGPSGARTHREGPIARLLKGNLILGTAAWRGCASRGVRGRAVPVSPARASVGLLVSRVAGRTVIEKQRGKAR